MPVQSAFLFEPDRTGRLESSSGSTLRPSDNFSVLSVAFGMSILWNSIPEVSDFNHGPRLDVRRSASPGLKPGEERPSLVHSSRRRFEGARDAPRNLAAPMRATRGVFEGRHPYFGTNLRSEILTR